MRALHLCIFSIAVSPHLSDLTRLDNDGPSGPFVEGTKPTLIRNAKIWTGHDDGKEVIHEDVLLGRGLVVDAGKMHDKHLQGLKGLNVIDAKGRWVTPDWADSHSHIGVDSSPHLNGLGLSPHIQRELLTFWLTHIDGINTHDQALELAISGGVATVQVLPVSANNTDLSSCLALLHLYGSRLARVVKHSLSSYAQPPKIYDIQSPRALQALITPPSNLSHLRWRHMRHACGENVDRVCSQIGTGAAWNFRQDYDGANDAKNAQDAFFDVVEAEEWGAAIDLDMIVRISALSHQLLNIGLPSLSFILQLSNEFKLPAHPLHRGGDAHPVPDSPKKPTYVIFLANTFKPRR
ncbi:hypothetical protein D9756_010732 [Leucocoprinus leucothites]|uniref:Amidohydrolase-related domain-containing protein n=1 Tax=Leucocoprinus leucothites TaxID=201217 RepID=A0A8H5FT26_9AGAR|nr:hypothetical protein D9756_010732 [Leucoagaricus leucothites]